MSLNVLIDRGKIPKEGTEYILVRDVIHSSLIWEDKSIVIPAGTVVVNVTIKKDNHFDFLGYNFKVKETGLIFHTNYPWILAENSSENLVILEKIRLQEAALKLVKNRIELTRKSLKTLEL